MKKKSRLFTFLIVCSLLISENALAKYEKNCCSVTGIYSSFGLIKRDHISIFFAFFEYEPKHGVNNSYLQSFKVEYLTDNAVKYRHLMSASTENQTTMPYAWIDFKEKKNLEKIDLSLYQSNQMNHNFKEIWEEGTNPRLEGAVGPISKTFVWCAIEWYPKEILLHVTHICVTAKWYDHKWKKTEDVSLIYNITPPKRKLNSNILNFSNSSLNQEISTEEKNNSVKAYKEANAIVIEGALDEKIQVYTTTGVLLKSMVANREVLQIPVPANQLYIVYVGKDRYMLAL